MHLHRPKEDQNFWNFLFSVFFVIVLAAAVYHIHTVRGSWPTSVPLFDLMLMVLASFRITRLVVYDKISRWFRELFADTRTYEQDGVVFVEILPIGSGFRHTVYDLLNCPWCIGIWGGLVVVYGYYVFPFAWIVILFLAMAGLASVIQVAANLIGWGAENLKMEAQEKNRDLRL